MAIERAESDPMLQFISGPSPEEYPEVVDAWLKKLSTRPITNLDASAADVLAEIRGNKA